MSIIEVTGNPRHDQLVHYITERGYMNIEETGAIAGRFHANGAQGYS